MRFLCSICKYFITASVIKLFSSLLFNWTGNGESSPWFLLKRFSQPIQPELLLHDFTAWRQGHFDWHSKYETIFFNILFVPWPQLPSLFFCLLVMTMRIYLFFPLRLFFFLELKLKRTFWMQKLKHIFSGKQSSGQRNDWDSWHIRQNYYWCL